MSDKTETTGSGSDPNPEPPSSSGGRPEETDRQSDSWFDRLRAAVGLKSPSVRRDLQEALSGEEPDDTFAPAERAMLHNILALRDIRVEDIMIPRADVDAIEIKQSLAELLGRYRSSGHSRMPVYRESLDDPVGMVHIKDVVRYLARGGKPAVPGNGEALDSEPIDLTSVDLGVTIGDAELVRDVLFVPPSMPVANILTMMQTKRTQMALVIDEYGGTDGLVSIEDAVETIVGEIEDEYDDEEPEIVADGNGVYIADARAELDDVADILGDTLVATGDDEIDTLGGVVLRELGRVPSIGETVTLAGGTTIEVLDANPRRIKRLKITVPESAGNEEPAERLGRAASGA